MLEQRVAALEAGVGQIDVKFDRIDAALRRFEPALGDRVAGDEAHPRAMPAFIQLAVALISTRAAGTAIVFALLKATHT